MNFQYELNVLVLCIPEWLNNSAYIHRDREMSQENQTFEFLNYFSKSSRQAVEEMNNSETAPAAFICSSSFC